MNNKISFLILIVVLIFSLILINNNQRSPEKTVRIFFESIDKKDKNTFLNVVAIETFINNNYTIIKEGNEKTEDDLFSEMDKILRLFMLNFFSSINKDEFKLLIDNYFISNYEERSIIDHSFVYNFINKFYFDDILISKAKINNKKAIVESMVFNFKYESNFKIVFLLDFQKEWKIISITNINEIIQKIKTLEKNRRNQSIIKKTREMNRYLFIEEYSFLNENNSIGGIDTPEIKHLIKVKNKGNIGISRFRLKITFKDNNDSITVEQEVNSDAFIDVGESKTFSFKTWNPFLKSQVIDGFVPEINHISIFFENGQYMLNEDNEELRFYEE